MRPVGFGASYQFYARVVFSVTDHFIKSVWKCLTCVCFSINWWQRYGNHV